MTSKTRGPVDTEEVSGNPFEGFRGKLHMWSRWVWVEGDLLATGCPLAPWERQCWLHPMQLSLITSPQKAYCDDAIPLEAQDIPVDYPLIRITFSLSFSWCWLQFEKSMIWLIIFHYRIDTGGGWVIHTQPMTFLIYQNADEGTRWRKCTCWAALSSLKTSECRHTCVSPLLLVLRNNTQKQEALHQSSSFFGQNLLLSCSVLLFWSLRSW